MKLTPCSDIQTKKIQWVCGDAVANAVYYAAIARKNSPEPKSPTF